jgi:hypothetical protein
MIELKTFISRWEQVDNSFYYSKTIELISQKKAAVVFLRKKSLQGRQCFWIDPALDFLPPSLHSDETGLTKLFYMMGYRGGYNTQILPEFTDTGASLLTGGAVNTGNRTRLAAGDQAHENF